MYQGQQHIPPFPFSLPLTSGPLNFPFPSPVPFPPLPPSSPRRAVCAVRRLLFLITYYSTRTLFRTVPPCRVVCGNWVSPPAYAHANQLLRSASSHEVSVPRHRLSTYGRRAFAVAGPTVWNYLPEDMRDPDVSEDSYRQSLKTFLFAQY